MTTKAPRIGQKMEDGSIYAGMNKDRTEQIYVYPQDFTDRLTLSQTARALGFINNNNTFGHSDWKIPTLGELDVIRGNKEKGALRGTFNGRAESFGYTDTAYLSSTRDGDHQNLALTLNIKDGRVNAAQWNGDAFPVTHTAFDRGSLVHPVRTVKTKAPAAN